MILGCSQVVLSGVETETLKTFLQLRREVCFALRKLARKHVSEVLFFSLAGQNCYFNLNFILTVHFEGEPQF